MQSICKKIISDSSEYLDEANSLQLVPSVFFLVAKATPKENPLKTQNPFPDFPERGLACSQGITNCIFRAAKNQRMRDEVSATLFLSRLGCKAQMHLQALRSPFSGIVIGIRENLLGVGAPGLFDSEFVV